MKKMKLAVSGEQLLNYIKNSTLNKLFGVFALPETQCKTKNGGSLIENVPHKKKQLVGSFNDKIQAVVMGIKNEESGKIKHRGNFGIFVPSVISI